MYLGLVRGASPHVLHANPAVALQLDRALISPYDILKQLANVLYPLESLLFVGFSNHLAIPAAVKRPSKCSSTPQYRS